MKHRILYVNPNSLMGGGEINQLALIRHIDRSRFDVQAVVGAGGPYVDALRAAGIQTKVIQFEYLRLGSRRLPTPASVAELYRHVQEDGPHVIHSASLAEDHHSAIAALRARVPMVHDQQTMVPRALLFDKWRARHSAAIICISNAIRDSLLNAGMAAPIVEVIYSGVDPDIHKEVDGLRIRRELNLSGFDVVGIASRLAPEKGHTYFLQAAALLKDKFPNCKFIVVGSPMYAPPEYEVDLREAASSLGLDNQIIFTGFRADVLHVMAAMDVLVCAADEEALGRVVLEAMALGKPVVATRAGGIVETVVDGVTGFLVPPRDPASLASAISACLTDLDAARRMGLKGQERVRAFYSIHQNADRVQRLYRRILEPASGGSPDERADGR
ncbi:MAG TPA: glycosyltransferase [Planctomycetota bacterium]|nr:glycosyltransferase [Planctomycetota bacterium]